nr:MAG TPA_asm: hypothetical protein [Caudoviricetes sp.]DAT27416.1 MAG TPA: hypothetical protein [Caudoviricetes sp.]
MIILLVILMCLVSLSHILKTECSLLLLHLVLIVPEQYLYNIMD